jgi:hypothetical protein
MLALEKIEAHLTSNTTRPLAVRAVGEPAVVQRETAR